MAVKNSSAFEQLYQRKKKEKEQEQADAFYEQYQQAVQRQKEINSIRANSHKKLEAQATKNSTVTSSKADDLAPVKTTTSSKTDDDIAPVKTTVSSDGEENTWFKEGEGSIWQKILGSATDIRENLAAGIIGLGEKFVDAGAQLGALMNRQVQMQAAQDEMIFNTLAGNKTDATSVLNKNLAYQKEVEKGTAEFIAKDLYDEEAVAKLLITKPYETVYGVNVEDSSVFGKKSESLIQSGGQLLGTAALQAAGVPWWMTSGTSAFGSEVESAYNNGATFDEATLSGAISAGAEILTEKLGGISFGGASLTDDAVKLLSKGVTNKVAKALMKVGKLTANGLAEGGEEVLSGYISAIGQKLTYMDEAEMSELFSNEEALDSFIGGFVLGEIGEFGDVAKSSVTGEDYVTGLTKSEQTVVDKIVEERAKETDSSKRKVYDDVLKDLKKGYISTDAIESVLGGDTYKAYKDSIDSESRLAEQKESLTEEFNTLNRMKTGEMTGEQTDRLNELRTKISDINKQIEKAKQDRINSGIKSKLSDEVVNRLKSDRGGQGSMLLESYNEQSRRGQAYEADISQYDESQRAVIQKAVDSGILNNTNRTHEFVDMIAKISADKGVLFDFANNAKLKESGFALDGKTVNGYVTKDGITLNIDSKKSLNSVVGHEITHVLEGTDLYTELQTALFDYAKSKNDYQGRYDSIAKLYEGIEGTDVDTELTADLIGDYLFTDADFINSLSANHRSIFQKIYDEIKYLCKVATAGSKEAKELEKIKKLFAEAYRTETKNTTQEDGVRYSLSERFHSEYDAWDGRDPTIHFEVGTTSEVLKNLGIAEKSIVWDSSKIIKIKSKHPEMTDTIIKQVPEILEDPIIVMESKTNPTRLTMFGEVYTAEGKPILAVLELHPTKNDIAIDEIKIASAYPKDNAQRFIDGSKILYVDKNKERTDKWSQLTRLQLPVNYELISPNDNISPSAENVNGKFSLSEDLAPVAPVGTYNVYGKDIELAPVRKDLQTQKASDGRLEPAPVVDWDDITGEDGAVVEETAEIDKRSLKTLSRTIGEKLSLNSAGRGKLEALIQEYAQGKYADKEALRAEIERQFGEKQYEEIDKELKTVKDEIRDIKINIDDDAKADFADGEYANFRRSNFGKIRFSKDGRSVNEVYRELTERYPHLFPDDIWNSGDQIRRISDIASKPTKRLVSTMLDESTIDDATDYVIDSVSEYFEIKHNSAGKNASNLTDATPRRTAKTVSEKIADKISSIELEMENVKEERRLSYNDFYDTLRDMKKRLQAIGDSDPSAKEELQTRIDRTTKLRQETDEKYKNELDEMEKEAKKYASKSYRRYLQRAELDAVRTDEINALIGDTSTWKDKKLGLSYSINTLHRNLRDIVRDANGKRDLSKADAIYEYLQGIYNHNEAELKRESKRIKAWYADKKITKQESEYIQMLGEYRHNPDTTLKKEDVENYYAKHQNKIDAKKVDEVIAKAREDYDALYNKVNEVLREQGMKELEYRKGYFPHFTDEKQGFLGKLFNWKTRSDNVPTDLAGMTEQFKPNKSYQSFDKQRTLDDTDYNFLKGFDNYVHGALDWIYHIDDIQRRRALENEIRYRHSEQGIKDKLREIKANEAYDADDVQMYTDAVYSEAKNPLNNFVIDLRRGTNAIANKKSSFDREMEYKTNRRAYSMMTNISNRVSANMVAGSISSALTNFIPITQSWGQVSPVRSLVAMVDVIRNTYRDDGLIEKSDFMTNRLRDEANLYQTGWDKASKAASAMMNVADNFTTQVVWRSKYSQNLSKGMSEADAIKNADVFAENVMAGRSRGNMPTAFNAKNSVAKMFTAFQLEVANQYGYMLKDMPQDVLSNDVNARKIASLTWGYVRLSVGAYLYNALYSALTGREAAFDPIGILEDLLGDLGFCDDGIPKEILETLRGIEDDEEKDEEVDIFGATLGLAENVAQELPFIGGLLGGGRMPISSALPYEPNIEGLEALLNDMEGMSEIEGLKDKWTSKYAKSFLGELSKPVMYLALPMAGGQIKKSIEGLSMFSDEHPIAGSYTDSGNLRFPVEDTPLNRIQASLFGQWASENARDYFDNERSPLKEKQIQEFIDVDMPIQDYWEYREGLAKQDTLEAKFDYIAGLDLPVEKKNILINNVVDRKEDVDLTDYNDFASYEEFDFATKNPEKYDFLQANDISYKKYNATEESREAYNWAFNNPEKLTLSKAIKFDVPTYKRCLSVIGKFNSKDENGETVSGLKKERVKDYIFNKLNIDYGAKCILFKSQGYSVDDSMNREIINYLNEREDISDEEIEAILVELGFTVYPDGTVDWD